MAIQVLEKAEDEKVVLWVAEGLWMCGICKSVYGNKQAAGNCEAGHEGP